MNREPDRLETLKKRARYGGKDAERRGAVGGEAIDMTGVGPRSERGRRVAPLCKGNGSVPTAKARRAPDRSPS
jgi:hypothetical protein